MTEGTERDQRAAVEMAVRDGSKAPDGANYCGLILRREFMQATETELISGALPGKVGQICIPGRGEKHLASYTWGLVLQFELPVVLAETRQSWASRRGIVTDDRSRWS